MARIPAFVRSTERITLPVPWRVPDAGLEPVSLSSNAPPKAGPTASAWVRSGTCCSFPTNRNRSERRYPGPCGRTARCFASQCGSGYSQTEWNKPDCGRSSGYRGTMTEFVIRTETALDRTGITELLLSAFPTSLEARLVGKLRRDSDLVLSLVAVDGTDVIGHAGFSRLLSPCSSLALAPVAVAASRRRQGIAYALIKDGLERARAGGWQAVIVLGDPDYYRRFGFSHEVVSDKTCRYAGPALMGLTLAKGGIEELHINYASAFSAIENSG